MNATFSPSGNASAPESLESLQNDLAASPASLSTDVLLKAIEEAKGTEVRLQKQIDEMQRRLARIQEEARILTKLIALRSGKALAAPVNEVGHVQPGPPLNTVTVAKSSHNALEAVVAILEEATRPVHISDLMRLLRDKNVQIPGSGTQANLISHLRRDKRIVRPSRGMYGLAAWGLTEMPSRLRRRRKRRRAR
jgi:hypothetical protein